MILRRTRPRQGACRTPRCRDRKQPLGRDTRCTPREKEEQGEAQGARDDADLGKISGDAIGNVGHELGVRVDDSAALVVAEAPQHARKAAAQ